MEATTTYERNGFISMPPGHNKYFIQNNEDGLYNAESVVDPYNNQELVELSIVAALSDDWAPYYDRWGALLNEQLAFQKRKIVVMVPRSQLGVAAKWTDLGGVVLEKSVWRLNLNFKVYRSKLFEDEWKTEFERGGTVCYSNLQLSETVMNCLDRWQFDI